MDAKDPVGDKRKAMGDHRRRHDSMLSTPNDSIRIARSMHVQNLRILLTFE
jgi:hypothetical protein